MHRLLVVCGVLIISVSARAEWQKLYFSAGNDNIFADLAIGEEGLPIVAVGSKSTGIGGASVSAMYSENGVDFLESSTGSSGLSALTGVAWTGGNTFVATRQTFSMTAGMTSAVLRSINGGHAFLQSTTVENAIFLGVNATRQGFVVIHGTIDEAPAAWLSFDGGQNLEQVAVPTAGNHVYAMATSILGPSCAFSVGGDGGEIDEEGNVVRDVGHGALWKMLDNNAFELVQQDLDAVLHAVDFVSPNVGLVGGRTANAAYLARTDDGGATLSPLTLPQYDNGSAKSIVSIRCFDTQRCMVLVGYGNNDTFTPILPVTTADAGQNWTIDTSIQTGLSFFEKASAIHTAAWYGSQLAVLGGANHIVFRYSDPSAAAEQRSNCGTSFVDAGQVSDAAAANDTFAQDVSAADTSSSADKDASTGGDAPQFQEVEGVSSCACQNASNPVTVVSYAVATMALLLLRRRPRRHDPSASQF